MMDRANLTFWEIIIEGLKKFAGEIIGGFLLAVFLLFFPELRSLIVDYTFPKTDESQTNIQQELEQRPKEEALREAEEAGRKTELDRQPDASKATEESSIKAETPKATAQNSTHASMPKRPAMSDAEFIELCEKGNAQEVEEAIMNGANVNAKTEYHTALFWAVEGGNIEKVKVLLRHGADFKKTDHNGSPALVVAAWSGYTEIVRVLLQSGSDVNARDNYGHTALMRAAWGGYTETARVLLQNGANVNARDNKRRTALTWAKRNNHTETANLLRKYGAK